MTAGEVVLIITSLGGLITGIIGSLVAAATAKNAAKKDALVMLQNTIEALQKENQRLFSRIEEYESKIDNLEKELEESVADPEAWLA